MKTLNPAARRNHTEARKAKNAARPPQRWVWDDRVGTKNRRGHWERP